MKIKAAALQFAVRDNQYADNLAAARRLIERAAADGARLLVLPELWYSGYQLSNIAEFAQEMSGEAVSLTRELAAAHGVYIFGSVAERRHGNYYNTLVAVDDRGTIIAKYRKAHLFRHYLREQDYMTAGDQWVLADYQQDGEQLCMGLMICYDLRFPEFARNIALRGAQLLIVPAAWAAARIDEFELFCRARAAENRCFLIACNYCGGVYNGNSLIVSPRGELLAKQADAEGVLSAELDSAVFADGQMFNPLSERRHILDEIDDSLL
ncbi:MAG: nitrilase-related carbon-nitrogen hydrolase [Bacillota bacterium]|nr:nitrilase-related carbon-nitrogen hydrolase [Bacillota bacterium]